MDFAHCIGGVASEKGLKLTGQPGRLDFTLALFMLVLFTLLLFIFEFVTLGIFPFTLLAGKKEKGQISSGTVIFTVLDAYCLDDQEHIKKTIVHKKCINSTFALPGCYYQLYTALQRLKHL